jgi:hypothetical protein
VRLPLTQLAESKRRRFPVDDLVSLNRTADMVIDWTLKGFE